ncbi:glycosyltransferase family 4 protein [Soonwooa sp.]|uniref:glycosyltransferase family 4 protein n=1 Tax=Soonwooa sp. TaxID=1938592 RepID=UPI002607EA1B|nr:glycosyltransferase family 4 protein [Soonwooa sp.]
MKLLYCIPSLSTSGGTERILFEKINFLISHNIDIIVVTTEGINEKPFFSIDSRIKIVELNINFNSNFKDKLYRKYINTHKKLIEYKAKLEQILVSESVDICISTGAKEIEFLYKLKMNCKKICELHFSQEYRKQAYLSRNLNLFWKFIGDYRTKLFIKQTQGLDALVVLTKEDEKTWRLTNANVIQIYNFSAIESEKVAKLNNKVVIAVGRLTEQKGLDRLIQAWSLVSKKNKDWILKIYGTGELEDELKYQARSLNLVNSISFEGQTKNITEKILDSSIFALSSRYEGFPLVLLESITCGVPIVSFDCKTGPNEIIINDDCGILVQDSNIEKFAEALDALMCDFHLRVDKGSAAKITSAKFSKPFIMNEWIQLFNKLSSK